MERTGKAWPIVFFSGFFGCLRGSGEAASPDRTCRARAANMHESTQLTIRPANRHDQDLVSKLLAAAPWKHLHLDWLCSHDLLETQPFLIAIQDALPVGCLGLPPDVPRIAWLRVFAVASGFQPAHIWKQLWNGAVAAAHSCGITLLAALPIERWFPPLLKDEGFESINSVVFLEWDGPLPHVPRSGNWVLRAMQPADLPGVIAVDQRAFEPLWQLSRASLEEALSQATVASVASMDDHLVGFHISTASSLGAHLARLAVDPDYQGIGLGLALTVDALRLLTLRGYERVSVNTQSDNRPSLRMYRRLGFRTTGHEYPVYSLSLTRQ